MAEHSRRVMRTTGLPVTDDMVERAARSLADRVDQAMPTPNYLREYARAALSDALGGYTPAQPEIDWTVVEAAVKKAITEHALSYMIPANRLCDGDPEREQRMAESWGQAMAPHVVYRIREAQALTLWTDERRGVTVARTLTFGAIADVLDAAGYRLVSDDDVERVARAMAAKDGVPWEGEYGAAGKPDYWRWASTAVQALREAGTDA